jgi:hypothetical protein
MTYSLQLIESTFNAGFLESLWRDIDMNRLNRHTKSKEINLVIVSHGVTMRVFLMRWFKWTTQQFEKLHNPSNCEVRVMQLGEGGEYSLLVHHTKEELEKWGLTPDMIKDQECRKTAKRGQWSDHWAWSGTDFFDHFEENVDCKIEAEGDERFSDVDSGKHNLVNGNGNRHLNDDDLTPLDIIKEEDCQAFGNCDSKLGWLPE